MTPNNEDQPTEENKVQTKNNTYTMQIPRFIADININLAKKLYAKRVLTITAAILAFSKLPLDQQDALLKEARIEMSKNQPSETGTTTQPASETQTV